MRHKVPYPNMLLTIGYFLLVLALPVIAIPLPHTPRKVDEYGNISFKDEKERLHNFAIEVKMWPDSIGLIVVYGRRRACTGEASARAIRARNYLLKEHGIEWNKVMWKDGGFREELTVELWVLPRAATNLSLAPTVDPKDVQIIKNCGEKSPKRRGRGASYPAPNNGMHPTALSVALINLAPCDVACVVSSGGG